MLSFLTQEDILAVRHVDRWHMVEVRKRQNIAEHSCTVALIAGKLAAYLREPLMAQEKVDMYEGCLLHDTPELDWGDMPTPTKKFLISKGLGWVLELMEVTFWTKRGSMTRPMATSTNRVKALVRLADLVEAHTFYRKEGVDMSIRAQLHSDTWDHFNEHFKDENDMASQLAVFMVL